MEPNASAGARSALAARPRGEQAGSPSPASAQRSPGRTRTPPARGPQVSPPTLPSPASSPASPVLGTPRRPLPSAGSRVTGVGAPDPPARSPRPAARREPEAFADLTAAGAARGTGARGHARGPDLRWSGADDSRGEGPGPPLPLRPLPSGGAGCPRCPSPLSAPQPGRARRGAEGPEVAPGSRLPHPGCTCAPSAQLGEQCAPSPNGRTGCFNRAAKRMVTYIWQELHLPLRWCAH